MHIVKRAIIMAAGQGKRMNPVTLNTPKPLVKVNGIRIIDTVIQGLYKHGITEIYVVVGYMKEKFAILKSEYTGLTLIDNPFYETCNNISSLYMAREYLEEAIILDGDQIIYNDSILSPEFDKSGYNAIWTDEKTDEWLMKVKNGKVISCSFTGGSKGWQLFGISRWTAEDGRKLKHHLEIEFDKKKNRQIYWDNVVMSYHLNEYDLGIKEMNRGDIIEIDNLSELIALDDTYLLYRGLDDENR